MFNGMSTCPRCNQKSFEHLKTYSHCVNCNHVVDRSIHSGEIVFIPEWAREAFKDVSREFEKSFPKIRIPKEA